MEEVKEDKTKSDEIRTLAAFDPERLPYAPRYLCLDLGELEEEPERADEP